MGIFQTILQDGIAKGHLPNKTKSARQWYRDRAQNFGGRIRGDATPGYDKKQRVDYARNLDKRIMRESIANQVTEIKPGSMYMYYYDPKWKDELPFYDKFPLIFPFRVKPDRFWGINLHYLSLPLRAKLMDALYDLTNNKRYDEKTKLKISWEILMKSSKTHYVKACVKQYLKSHTRSHFLYVEPEHWDIAIWLPLEKFEKKNKAEVWSNSKQILGIRK